MLEHTLRCCASVMWPWRARMPRTIGRRGSSGGAIRTYLAAISGEQTLDDRGEAAKVQEILAAVINFEHIADILANSLTDFYRQAAQARADAGARGNRRGREHAGRARGQPQAGLERVPARRSCRCPATGRAQATLAGAGRRGYAGECPGAATTPQSGPPMATAIHSGSAAEESGLLLRIVRDLRRVHSHLASFAYPVLRRPRPQPRARRARAPAPSAADRSWPRHSGKRLEISGDWADPGVLCMPETADASPSAPMDDDVQGAAQPWAMRRNSRGA